MKFAYYLIALMHKLACIDPKCIRPNDQNKTRVFPPLKTQVFGFDKRWVTRVAENPGLPTLGEVASQMPALNQLASPVKDMMLF